MCGIAGFHIKDNLLDKKNILKKMNDKLSHRGPDGEGFFTDDYVSFSHKRLAIIDLNSRSDQPFKDENENFVLVFNGEIYNYVELKHLLVQKGFKFSTTSDTEVLLNGLIKFGYQFLNKVEGMFAFALYDNKKKELLLGRDHVGMKPLYYSITPRHFVFGSEPKVIFKTDLVQKKIK